MILRRFALYLRHGEMFTNRVNDYSTWIKVNKWIDSFNDKLMIIKQATVKHWKFLLRLNKFQLNDQKLTIN